MFNDSVMQKKRECKTATKSPIELYNLEVLIEGNEQCRKENSEIKNTESHYCHPTFTTPRSFVNRL